MKMSHKKLSGGFNDAKLLGIGAFIFRRFVDALRTCRRWLRHVVTLPAGGERIAAGRLSSALAAGYCGG